MGGEVRKGLSIVGVPTSEATHAQAQSLGIPLATLEEMPELDLVIDGADELDSELRLIKGGGGALLREKIVAASSKRMLVIVDASKKVDRLGKFPLPIEVVPFGFGSTRELNATKRPSGDHSGFVAPLGSDVSGRASPPSASESTKICGGPPRRVETNASFEPSGDHRGPKSRDSPKVTCRSRPVATSASQMLDV